MSSIKKVLCIKAKNNHDRTFITNKIYDVEIDGWCGWVKDENGYSTCILFVTPCIYGEWKPLEEYMCMTSMFSPDVKLGDAVFGYEFNGVFCAPGGIKSISLRHPALFIKKSGIPLPPLACDRHEVRHVIYDAKDNKVVNDAMGECYITLAEAQELCDEMNAPKLMKPAFTKEVEYFGVKIMVPDNAKYLATSMSGTVLASDVAMKTGICTWGNDSAIYTVCVVDLNGIDWKETLMEIK